MTRWLALAAVLAAPAALACVNGKFEANPHYNTPRTEALDLVAAANTAFAGRDFEGSLKQAEAALATLTPTSPVERHAISRARLIAGQAAIKLGKYAVAEAHLAPLGDAQRATSFVQARLAEARLGTDQVARARAVLEALASEDRMPDDQAWLALARARSLSGDEAGALEAAQQADERAPAEDPEVLAYHPEPKPQSKAPVAGALGVSFAGLAIVLARRRGRLLARARSE
jgi:hypothetical protein